MIKTRIIQLFVVVLMVSGCSGTSSKAPQIAIQDAWSRAAGGMGGAGMDITPMPEAKPMQGMNGAVYLVLKNTGGAADNLLRAESDVANVVELHKSEMIEGVMRMNPVEYIEIPAGESVELKPGGLHIMLIGLKQALNPGDRIALKLFFEVSGEMIVEAEVRTP